MKGYDRAAAVLSLLGDELSQKILSYVPEESAVAIMSASEALKTPSREDLLEAVTEFNSYMMNAGKTPPEHHTEEPVPPAAAPAAIQDDGTPLGKISAASAQSLAKALDTDRPEIAAYVLTHLSAEKIYETMNLLKENRQQIEGKILSIKDVPMAKELEEKILKNIAERLS